MCRIWQVVWLPVSSFTRLHTYTIFFLNLVTTKQLSVSAQALNHAWNHIVTWSGPSSLWLRSARQVFCAPHLQHPVFVCSFGATWSQHNMQTSKPPSRVKCFRVLSSSQNCRETACLQQEVRQTGLMMVASTSKN